MRRIGRVCVDGGGVVALSDNELMIAFSNPAEGKEDEFNAWYADQHIPDVLAVDGLIVARRYGLTDVGGPSEGEYRYLAIYEIESGRTLEARAALIAAVKSGKVRESDSLGEVQTLFFSPIGDRQERRVS
jgi:hypothetical protein